MANNNNTKKIGAKELTTIEVLIFIMSNHVVRTLKKTGARKTCYANINFRYCTRVFIYIIIYFKNDLNIHGKLFNALN